MKRRDFLKGVALALGLPLAAAKSQKVFRNWPARGVKPTAMQPCRIIVLGSYETVEGVFPLEPAWHITKLEC